MLALPMMSAFERAVSRLVIAAITLILTAPASSVCAQTCAVPGSHTTIQEAADDPACATITLAAQTYPESIVIRRSLTLAGPATGGVASPACSCADTSALGLIKIPNINSRLVRVMVSLLWGPTSINALVTLTTIIPATRW